MQVAVRFASTGRCIVERQRNFNKIYTLIIIPISVGTKTKYLNENTAYTIFCCFV